MEILQLSYRSVRPEWTHDAEVIEGIVLPSLRRNRVRDITGCLWFGPTLFYHVLEGGSEGVERLFAVISSDPRHHSIRCMSRRSLESRQFDRFTMRVVRPHDEVRMIRLLDLLGPWHPQPARVEDTGVATRSQSPEMRGNHRSFAEAIV